MKALQWTMTIPKDKQKEFEKWFKEVAGSKLNSFGAIKHEIYRVEEKLLVGRQVVENDKYIERVYFDNGFDIPKYFATVKADTKAWKESRKFESEFGARDVELRIVNEI